MSRAEVLGVIPDRRPTLLVELRNAHRWSPMIWKRLLIDRGEDPNWWTNDKPLDELWNDIDTLPEWQQAPLILTFDVGVIPWQAYEWAAEMIDEFDAKAPPVDYPTHCPTVADLLRSKPEVPLIGVYGTSVTDNPFDPWDEQADAPGNGLALDEMYVLERHRHLINAPARPSEDHTP